jgi:hypothetical protein
MEAQFHLKTAEIEVFMEGEMRFAIARGPHNNPKLDICLFHQNRTTMSTLLRKRIAANQGECFPDTLDNDTTPNTTTDHACTPGPLLRAYSHIIVETPPDGGEQNANTPITGHKRRLIDDWSKERLIYEYQKLMKLRIQASIKIADASEAHKHAVAASGSVVEQERSILAHVAKRAHVAFQKKQEALDLYVAKYERSRNDANHAFNQIAAVKSASDTWKAKLMNGSDGSDDESPCLPDIMATL